MTSDEYRPNPPTPAPHELRRQYRLEVERPIGLVSVTIEDPESYAEIEAFFKLARKILDR